MQRFYFLAVFIPLFLAAVTIHEFSHGLVAYFLGDPTARERGRLTLNPLKHLDPLWTVALPVLLVTAGLPAIGVAKPVPVDFSRLRRPRSGMIWVALAGPLANILLAFCFTLLYNRAGWDILLYAVYFNLGLAVFNLIPVPPLDGSRILTGLLPLNLAREYVKIEKFGFLITVALVWFGIIWRIVVPGINFFCNWWRIPLLG